MLRDFLRRHFLEKYLGKCTDGSSAIMMLENGHAVLAPIGETFSRKEGSFCTIWIQIQRGNGKRVAQPFCYETSLRFWHVRTGAYETREIRKEFVPEEVIREAQKIAA